MDKNSNFFIISNDKIQINMKRYLSDVENKKMCQHKILYPAKISISSEADYSISVWDVENPKKMSLLH